MQQNPFSVEEAYELRRSPRPASWLPSSVSISPPSALHFWPSFYSVAHW